MSVRDSWRVVLLVLVVTALYVSAKANDSRGCITSRGWSYRGTTSSTKHGYECQNWTSNYPHRHRYHGASFSAQNQSQAKNYCRNPRRRGKASGRKPWCYTTDKNQRRDYCDIPRCTPPGPKPARECIFGAGVNYRGTTSRPRDGYTCQKWASNFPHPHRYHHASFSNQSQSLAHNYCRNPVKDGKTSGHQPWCFTTNWFRRWTYCKIPKC